MQHTISSSWIPGKLHASSPSLWDRHTHHKQDLLTAITPLLYSSLGQEVMLIKGLMSHGCVCVLKDICIYVCISHCSLSSRLLNAGTSPRTQRKPFITRTQNHLNRQGVECWDHSVGINCQDCERNLSTVWIQMSNFSHPNINICLQTIHQGSVCSIQ